MIYKMKNEYLENIVETYGDMVYRLALAREILKNKLEGGMEDE